MKNKSLIVASVSTAFIRAQSKFTRQKLDASEHQLVCNS